MSVVRIEQKIHPPRKNNVESPICVCKRSLTHEKLLNGFCGRFDSCHISPEVCSSVVEHRAFGLPAVLLSTILFRFGGYESSSFSHGFESRTVPSGAVPREFALSDWLKQSVHFPPLFFASCHKHCATCCLVLRFGGYVLTSFFWWSQVRFLPRFFGDV